MYCPADAIKVGGPGMTIVVDWDKCTGCGICVNVCPNQAYTLRNKGYKQIIDTCCRKITESGVLNISCGWSELPKNPSIVPFECIGIINMVDILLLYLRGARQIIIAFGDCVECDSKSGFKILQKELSALQTLAPVFEDISDVDIKYNNDNVVITFPKQMPIIRPIEEEKPNPTVNRRGMFSFFKDNVKETALKSASMMSVEKLDPRTIIKFEHAVSSRRKLFLDSVLNLGRLKVAETATGKLFNNIKIDDSCIFCGMCVRFCGSGALTINEDKTIITFNASKCNSCMLCQKACYHNKLKYTDTLGLKDFFTDVIVAEKKVSEKPSDT